MSGDPSGAWAALVRSALLGAERAGPLPPLPAEVREVEAAGEAAEERLLGGAALLSPWVRAGQQPATTAEGLEPAGADAAAPAGPRASEALAAILKDEKGAPLDEWCGAVRSAGRRVPDHLLPEFLDRLAKERSPALTLAMTEVLGARGVWLASLNAAWRPARAAAPADPAALWHTGTKAERLTLLAALRASDAPAARALLQATLEAEQPDDVAAFVDALEAGLSMADHDFLEGLLDARHKPVRTAAARLLARLPGSARSRRMTERLAVRLAFAAGEKRLILRRKPVLEVKLPEKEAPAEAKAMARDGLELQRKRGKLGPKAMTLLQLVAAAPLAWYASRWQAKPAELLEAALETEWAEALVAGWAEASIAQRDADWAQALLAVLSRQAGEISQALESGTAKDLFVLLPAARREAFLGELLQDRPKSLGEPWVAQLAASAEHAWTEDFSRLVLKAVRRCYPDASYAMRALLGAIAGRLSPSLAAEAAQGWPVESENWTPADRAMLERLLATLELRRNYLEELSR